MNTIMIVPTLQRGNASQDAPRPLSNVAQMRAQAPALPTSCAWLTESSVCAICDAERHGRHTHAEHGHDQCRGRLVYNDERRAWDQSWRLQRKRQRYVCFLALCQALFEFCGVVNQYVLPGKGLCRNQA